jgi:hypothetical protein
MAVNLVVSKTLSGAGAADALAGGGSGIDLGSVVNAEYCPITLKSANTGWQTIYIRHNATIDPITSVGTFIAQYSQTYGGADTAANDYATLISKGTASGNSANNNDGLSSGLRIEHDSDLTNSLGASAFDGTRAQVKIYGDSGTDGIDLASAFNLHVDALIYDSNAHGSAGTPVDATTPVTGKIGKDGDAVLGDHALVKLRFYLEDAAPNGGIIQWDWVIKYSFTA